MLNKTQYTQFARATAAFALIVIVLGAYVRLTDAGLGCPDWPGCYGTLTVPRGEAAIDAANSAYPERPVESGKAWREMAHRYVAGILGLLVFALAFFAWKRRKEPGQPLGLPMALSVLIILQAALGMWTVTLLLKPAVVTAHLLGGMTTLALLWWLALRSQGVRASAPLPGWLRPAAIGDLVILTMQIALGGWTSTNYAALACVDFPTCHGQWLPWMAADQAFQIWTGLGVDHEGGVLPNEARITIHGVHRLGALITFLYIGGLAAAILATTSGRGLRLAAVAMGAALSVQVGLGIANVLMSLPLAVATAHNGMAAVLAVTVVTIIQLTSKGRNA